MRVRNGNREFGWLHFPDLGIYQNAATEFTGGLIRYIRSDWHGAISYLKNLYLEMHYI
ncbi:MAG: hypothetical protein HRT83_00125 [Hyphomicrobiaceae bacterium]|nr:hypothetical protein [Hyphomicrobiaceae bacterium]